MDAIDPLNAEPHFNPNPFQHRIDGSEIVDPNSAQELANTFGDPNTPYRVGEIEVAGLGDTKGLTGPQFPVYFSVPADPVFKIHCTLYANCPLEGKSIHIPAGALPQDGYLHGGEAHMDVISRADGAVYGMYHVPAIGHSSGPLSIGYGGVCPFNGYANGGTCAQGSTAGNLPESAMLLRPSELTAAIAKNSDLGHALYISTCVREGVPAYPASARTGSVPQCMVNGQLIILKKTDSQIMALDVPPWERVILLTYAHYGLMADDNGTYDWSFGAQDDNDRIAFGLTPEWPAFIAAYVAPYAARYGYDTSISNGAYHIYFPKAGIKPTDFAIVSLKPPLAIWNR